MVNSNWTFTITHHQKDNSWSSTDISADAFPRYFTDTGGDKVNAAKLRIIAVDGQYIKDGVNSKPQIKHNDRVRIVATDGSGGTYNRVFDVIKIIPIKSKSEGVMVELELLGIERWLQKCNYSSRIFAETPKDIFGDLVQTYLDNRVGNTPTINLTTSSDPSTITVNELPTTIRIHLDWGNNEDTVFNRMQELVEKMSAPQTSGGVLDFFDIRFTCSTSNVTSINISVFSSGYASNSKPSKTLNSTDINTEETSGGFEEPQGLLLNAWGASDAGSHPPQWSKFNSKVTIMPEELGSKTLLPEWSNTFQYTAGAYVKYTLGSIDKVFKSKVTTTGNTPPNTGDSTYWEEISIQDYYGSFSYSPWTQGKQDYWNASMANPNATSGSPFGAIRVAWDANIVVLDDGAFRTWADIIAYNSSITSSHADWLYNGNTPYDGLRIFVKGAGNNDFANYSNCIMEYDDGKWIRKYELKPDMMVAVMEDAKVWKYDSGNNYSDFTTVDNGLDCFHPSSNSSGSNLNTTSSIRNRTDSSSVVDFTNNNNSAISQTYKWTPLENWWNELDEMIMVATGVVGAAVTYAWKTLSNGNSSTPRVASNDWYNAGAWLCLRFPFPKNTFGSLPASALGLIYGGGTGSGQEIVPHFDFQNMTYSANGKKGFNRGAASEDLGPISSIDFNMKIQYIANFIASGANAQLLAKESFKMKCVLIDRNDNVVTQDFTVLFNDNWESISLPLDGFNIYRGRKPIFKNGFFTAFIIPPKEKPLFTQFEWRHIAMMCIQSTDSYDDNGRYRGAAGNDWGTGHFLWNAQSMSYLQTTISIDALRFTKPLLANSGIVTDLLNEPDFIQSPDIVIYDALKQDLDSELQKHKFKNKRYDISTEGEFDIQFGDYFVLEDSDIVDETYLGDANRILLVAKHIEYEFSKPNDSAGGFERRILGAKRFT